MEKGMQDEAFVEDAITAKEVMGASTRFVGDQDGHSLVFQLAPEGSQFPASLTRDEILDMVEQALEHGLTVRVG